VTHPASQLDDIVHQRLRLGILAILVEAQEADFRFLREQLLVSEGNLSSHLRVLDEAGLVEIRKGFEGRRPRTWIRATDAGRASLDREVAALRELVARLDAANGGPPAS